MDALEMWLAARQGVITTPEAADLGVSHQELRRLARPGPGGSAGRRLVRLGRSAYADASVYAAADVGERHRLRVVAQLRTAPGLYMASHVSAAVVWGLPVLAPWLGRVHVARIGGGKTAQRASHTVHGCYRSEEPLSRDRVPVVSSALAVVGTALLHGLEAGVLAVDAALHQGLTTRRSLSDCLDAHARTPGLAVARAAVRLGDERTESPGESRLRLVLGALGLACSPQHEIRDREGRFVARVDFYLPSLGVVVEFDGAVKYAAAETAGRKALVAEKRREDRIRALGYGVVRVTWADLDHPARIERRIREAARIATRRG